MDLAEILKWLLEDDPAGLEELWRRADETRRAEVGDQVHLRGLIEISNICARQCHYCGLRAGNSALERYRMTADEIVQCAAEARQFGYGTVVLQAGEDAGIDANWIADIIMRIKQLPPAATNPQAPALAITLSLGERCEDDLKLWKSAGADRYLLRFETSNVDLFERIHPPLGKTVANREHPRLGILRRLRELGYEVGSGVMIGIPGQTFEDLARDIQTFAAMDLDMIGVGPFLPHPQTPLGQQTAFTAEDNQATARTLPAKNPQSAIRNPQSVTPQAQVPNTELMTYKTIALTRLACPKANIPSTTALATINKANGRELGLMRGANIVMPNMTPPKYRVMYEIYPAKACIYETALQCRDCLAGRIFSIGRTVGAGRGDSPNKTSR